MIPLQRPALTGDLGTQMRQMQAWAETLTTQLEMILNAIPEESLCEAVRTKLNGQSAESRIAIQELQAALQGAMNQ